MQFIFVNNGWLRARKKDTEYFRFPLCCCQIDLLIKFLGNGLFLEANHQVIKHIIYGFACPKFQVNRLWLITNVPSKHDKERQTRTSIYIDTNIHMYKKAAISIYYPKIDLGPFNSIMMGLPFFVAWVRICKVGFLAIFDLSTKIKCIQRIRLNL